MTDKTRVLIVEDEVTLGGNLRQFLLRRGWDVLLVRTGGMGVAAAQSFQPRVVLLDYQLPDIDGFDVLTAIRRTMHCDCVLMTGHPAIVVAARAQTHDIRKILYKPFSLAEMESDLLALQFERAAFPADPQLPIQTKH